MTLTQGQGQRSYWYWILNFKIMTFDLDLWVKVMTFDLDLWARVMGQGHPEPKTQNFKLHSKIWWFTLLLDVSITKFYIKTANWASDLSYSTWYRPMLWVVAKIFWSMHKFNLRCLLEQCPPNLPHRVNWIHRSTIAVCLSCLRIKSQNGELWIPLTNLKRTWCLILESMATF